MTVKVYTLPSNTSSRKAMKFLTENDIEFEEQKLCLESMTKEQMMEILENSYYGVDDILSERSNEYKLLSRKGIDFEDISLTKLHQLIVEHPRLLKAPILVDGRKINVGFNDEEIRSFIPKEVRRKEMDRLLAKMDKPRFRACDFSCGLAQSILVGR